MRCWEQKQFPFRSRCQALMGAAYSLVWSGLLPFGGVVCDWGDYLVSWLYLIEDWFAETFSAEASGLYFCMGVALGWLNMIRDFVLIWFYDVPMLCISEVRFRLPWVAAVAGVTTACFWGNITILLICDVLAVKPPKFLRLQQPRPWGWDRNLRPEDQLRRARLNVHRAVLREQQLTRRMLPTQPAQPQQPRRDRAS